MLYLDYAKPLADGKYILSFFADSVADLESISHGQKFVTKNGTDYGVPQAGSTVIVTSPNSGKTTYVMDAEGIWVVTEDISYSAVVANPSDAATAKLEKLKVNDTTYANWTQEEIKSIASESGGGKLYVHKLRCSGDGGTYFITVHSVIKEMFDDTYLKSHPNCLIGAISTKVDSNGDVTFDRVVSTFSAAGLPTNTFTINAAGITPPQLVLTLESDTPYDLDETFN